MELALWDMRGFAFMAVSTYPRLRTNVKKDTIKQTYPRLRTKVKRVNEPEELIAAYKQSQKESIKLATLANKVN